MNAEIDPRCKGCDYAPKVPAIDVASGLEVTDEIRIGDQTFNSYDNPVDVLQHGIANDIICDVCKDVYYIFKYPTPFKKFLKRLFKDKPTSGSTSIEESENPKQLLS
jgi:hypothetical protein